VFQKLLIKKHLNDDETLITLVHKFWVLGAKALFWPTVFIAIDIYLLWLFHTRGMLIVCAVLGVVCIVWWLRNFLDYYLDAWLITDQSIIDIEWLGWFHRQSTRILYSDVEGVSYEVKGILGTFLRYGTITVEKISTGTSIELPYVTRPRRVEKAILGAMEQYLHSKNLKDSKQVQELLATLVAEQIHKKEMSGDDSDDDA
jgi:hypothetical protein